MSTRECKHPNHTGARLIDTTHFSPKGAYCRDCMNRVMRQRRQKSKELKVLHAVRKLDLDLPITAINILTQSSAIGAHKFTAEILLLDKILSKHSLIDCRFYGTCQITFPFKPFVEVQNKYGGHDIYCLVSLSKGNELAKFLGAPILPSDRLKVFIYQTKQASDIWLKQVSRLQEYLFAKYQLESFFIDGIVEIL